MRDRVQHPDTGLELDFGQEDFGGPAEAEVIAEWRRWRETRSTRQGEFICWRHRNHERPWLYLQLRGTQVVAAHWPGTDLAGTHEITHGMSDEHKRQVEYLRIAGEAAGFTVGTEVSLPTRVRSDAVIYGPSVQMGVEVQRSPLTPTEAKRRTTLARRAGVQPVWFSDAGSDPSWFGAVPGVRMSSEVQWNAVPERRSVAVVSGVRVIVPRRCQNILDARCPQRRYGCNAWHATHEVRMRTFADDLAEMVPAGVLVPILFRRLSNPKLTDVLIVSAHDKARYEAMIHESADVPLRPAKPRVRQPGRTACEAQARTVGAIQQPVLDPEPSVLRPAEGCAQYFGAPKAYCGALPTRRYLMGPRCAEHAPYTVRSA